MEGHSTDVEAIRTFRQLIPSRYPSSTGEQASSGKCSSLLALWWDILQSFSEGPQQDGAHRSKQLVNDASLALLPSLPYFLPPLLLFLEVTSPIIYIHPSPRLWLYFGAVQTQILLPFSDLDISCVPVKQNYFWFVNYTMLLACVWNFSSVWNASHSGQRIIHPSRLISKTTKHHLLWKTSSVFYPNLYTHSTIYICVCACVYIHTYISTYVHFILLFYKFVFPTSLQARGSGHFLLISVSPTAPKKCVLKCGNSLNE